MNIDSLRIEPTTLSGDRGLILRMLEEDDGPRLAEYFDSLSESTKSLFGPHAFTHEEAKRIAGSCRKDVGRDTLFRYVVLHRDRIVGYFLLSPQIHESDGRRYRDRSIDPSEAVSYAPSVCDEYQGTGVGSAAFEVIRAAADSAGVRRLILMGGVQARNTNGRAYYRKLGFLEVGHFQTSVDNVDMTMRL